MPERHQAVLAAVEHLSDQTRAQRENQLVLARAEQTRLRTAIERLLGLVETGEMGPLDPIFAKRLRGNRAAPTPATARIDTCERSSRRITSDKVGRL